MYLPIATESLNVSQCVWRRCFKPSELLSRMSSMTPGSLWTTIFLWMWSKPSSSCLKRSWRETSSASAGSWDPTMKLSNHCAVNQHGRKPCLTAGDIKSIQTKRCQGNSAEVIRPLHGKYETNVKGAHIERSPLHRVQLSAGDFEHISKGRHQLQTGKADGKQNKQSRSATLKHP